MYIRTASALFIATCFTIGGNAAAEPIRPQDRTDTSHNFSLTVENDLFANRDQHYTNGIRFAYLPPQDSLPDWIENTIAAFPLFDPAGQKRLSFSFGQNMYTPQDIKTENPAPKDRPYAGWMYGSIGMTSDTGKELGKFDLTFGVVGPASLAGDTQKFVHEILDADQPRGWDTQLKNEPGIIASYEHKWRGLYEVSPFGLGADFTPHVGASVGNIFTYGAIGGTVRIGQDLQADYGPPLIRPSSAGSDFFMPSRSFGWYLFAGIEGRAIGRNIFLDGNTFASSRSVEKENFVGDVQFGIAMTIEKVRISYTHVFRTKEFVGQDEGDTFGALGVSMRF